MEKKHEKTKKKEKNTALFEMEIFIMRVISNFMCTKQHFSKGCDEQMSNSSLEAIREIIYSQFPEKIIVDISDYENEQHQTYKYLYETQCESMMQQTEEIYNLRFQNQNNERELSELHSELEIQKSVNAKLDNMTVNIMEFVEQFVEKEITVSNVKVMDNQNCEIVLNSDKRASTGRSISDKPGIYNGHRPSWFTPLKRELNKENAAKKVTDNTKHVLTEKLACGGSISSV